MYILIMHTRIALKKPDFLRSVSLLAPCYPSDHITGNGSKPALSDKVNITPVAVAHNDLTDDIFRIKITSPLPLFFFSYVQISTHNNSGMKGWQVFK